MFSILNVCRKFRLVPIIKIIGRSKIISLYISPDIYIIYILYLILLNLLNTEPYTSGNVYIYI